MVFNIFEVLLVSYSVVFFCVLGQDFEKPWPCQLTWLPMSTGNLPTENSVAAHSGKYYIVRHYDDESESYLLGYFDKENNGATFYEYNMTEIIVKENVTSFEILINPNSCLTSWEVEKSKYTDYAVTTDDEDEGSPLIARAPATDEFWFPGPLELDGEYVSIIVGEEIREFTNFQVLVSISQGLRLEVREFEYNMDAFGGPPMSMGVDHIINDGETILTQKVTHSRLVVETYEFPIRNDQTKLSKYTSGVTKQCGIPSFFGSSTTVTIDQKMSLGIEESKTVIKETKIEIEKVIRVPPYTQLTVCSTIDIKDGVVIPYTARGTYIAPGMDANTLLQRLESEGLDVFISAEGTVDTMVYGEFKGSVVFSTRFMSLDGIHSSCS